MLDTQPTMSESKPRGRPKGEVVRKSITTTIEEKLLEEFRNFAGTADLNVHLEPAMREYLERQRQRLAKEAAATQKSKRKP